VTRPPKRPSAGHYQVGYGKPPRHARFRPGVSGNPRGRPRGASAGRADRLALKEIYRLIVVREGDQTTVLPTVQAVIRQLGRIALKGKGPALRAYLAMVRAIEQSVAMQADVKAENEPQIRNVTNEARLEAVMALFNSVKRQDLPVPESGR
jgi:uncharacterized protein DUF5681